jgi:hypothetical protein
MVKKLDVDRAARQVTEALPPVFNVNLAADVKQTPLPAVQPLPAPLAKALGQTER